MLVCFTPPPATFSSFSHTCTPHTGLVILYGVFFGLSLFFMWFGVAAILVLCVTLYVVYIMSMQSTQILSIKVVDFAAKIETAKAHGSSDTEPGMNVPLLTSEKEHFQRQMVMLMFVFSLSLHKSSLDICVCVCVLGAGVSGSSSWDTSRGSSLCRSSCCLWHSTGSTRC